MSSTEYNQVLIRRLYGLVNNRAAMAKVRMAAQPTGMLRAAKYLEPVHHNIRPVYYAVASLFAHHPVIWRERATGKYKSNFGVSAGMLSGTANSVDAKFGLLLRADKDSFYTPLRGIVNLLHSSKSGLLPVDWYQLLFDLSQWDWPDHPTQLRWASSFYTKKGD